MSYTMDPHTEIGQVKLKVSHLDTSVDFYQQIVGLHLLERTASGAVFTAGGAHPLLLLEEVTGAVKLPRRSAVGLYHFALLLPNRSALGLSLRNLIESGIHIGSSDHLVSEALYITDPDNNGIEIYADRPRSSWQRDAAGDYIMATNPIDGEGLLAEAGDQTWTGLPKETKIGHIHLHVGDLEQAEAFYCRMLGFDRVSRYADSALFISAGGYHHHIGLNTWAGAGAPTPPPKAVGLAYFSIVFPDGEAMERSLVHFQSSGGSAIEQDGAWIVKDPSGIEVRLTVRK